MDIGDTLAPKSEQLDAIELVSGERIFTVREVKITAGEQPASVYFEEFDRPWRPGVNMRRVLSDLWGKGRTWPGHRIALYCDPEVVYGGKAVGGIRIRAMSHIGDKPRKVLILASQGRPDFYRVEPLTDDAPASPVVTDETLRALVQTFELKGIPDEARLAGVNQITGGSATDLDTITEAQALQVLESLKERPDA
jgi:hypothetical protein